MKKRRKHTEAFKRDAVKLMVNRGARTVEEVAKSVGVSPSLLHKWHQLYGESVAAGRSQEPSQGAEDTEALNTVTKLIRDTTRGGAWAAFATEYAP